MKRVLHASYRNSKPLTDFGICGLFAKSLTRSRGTCCMGARIEERLGVVRSGVVGVVAGVSVVGVEMGVGVCPGVGVGVGVGVGLSCFTKVGPRTTPPSAVQMSGTQHNSEEQRYSLVISQWLFVYIYIFRTLTYTLTLSPLQTHNETTSAETNSKMLYDNRG